MARTICVYCSSSDAVGPQFYDAAVALGKAIGDRGDRLVFGGVDAGLMGAVAKAACEHGAEVVGVIPEALAERAPTFADCERMIVTRDMRDRKAEMEKRSDAFVALPGGFGTLEELFETITLKQLRYHAKPVVLLNTADFYDQLTLLIEHLFTHRFAKPIYRELYEIVPDVAACYAYLDAYEPVALADKWSGKSAAAAKEQASS